MEKIKKLKELNDVIKKICNDLEIKIFIEGVDDVDNRIMKNYQPEVVETK